jgi:hypothetical protein
MRRYVARLRVHSLRFPSCLGLSSSKSAFRAGFVAGERGETFERGSLVGIVL